jgi:hypothetical protein
MCISSERGRKDRLRLTAVTLGDGGRVDGVGVVELGSRLGGTEAGQGGEDEGGGMHGDGDRYGDAVDGWLKVDAGGVCGCWRCLWMLERSVG